MRTAKFVETNVFPTTVVPLLGLEIELGIWPIDRFHRRSMFRLQLLQ